MSSLHWWGLLLGVFACGSVAAAMEHVTLQLKWRHQFQFAGYYVALEKGYYREAGLDVQLMEGMPHTNVVDEVVSGRAAFGVGTSDLILARRHAPVVVLGVIFQHSPLVLLAAENLVSNLHELVDQPVMIEAHSEEIFSYLRRERLPPERLKMLPHSQSPSDLIVNTVRAMTAYSTTEPYLLRKAGVRTIEFSPRAGGIDFYGDNLFTAEREIKKNPQRVEAFRAASLRGWAYAVKHSDEVIDLILNRYNTQGFDKEFLRFEAARTIQLMQPDLVEVGYMNPGRWQHIADVYASMDMKHKGVLPEGFLFDATPKRLPEWVLPVGTVGSLLLCIVGLLAAYSLMLSRKLKKQVAAAAIVNEELQHANVQLVVQLDEINRLQADLREQAIRDVMTSLYNRRYMDEHLPVALQQAKQVGYPFVLAILDLDHFKRVNDTYGHAVGDEVIRQVAQVIAASTSDAEWASRYGGEEFLIAFPNVTGVQAMMRVQEWQRQLQASVLKHGRFDIQTTFSAGIAAYPDHGADIDALVEAADVALYESKAQGRNKCTLYGMTTVCA